ncbi:REP-associated tyrosine transposase [Undibacterium pigrum]|uniref:Putative transposase n=1 Tax=Undibacterium pigrum TaxID=401470 RepID=A0A318J5K5_9BURK|nr:transposase [Undibacterium pigrum]PXX42703.1 putative transposase [Undibacterium pigrum]
MRYRRANVPGATYFFTVNLQNRKSQLLTEHIDILRTAFRTVQQRYPFKIIAMVVMPEHLHAIWELPQGDLDFSLRWSLIKAAFSKALPKQENISISRQQKRERGIWQRRFWEHLIRDDDDLEMHISYLHYNPVKHGYVDQASAWPHSSLHKFIAQGILDINWGETARTIELQKVE